MRWLLIALMFLASSCAYGQYNPDTGLFWVSESPMQRFYRQDNENWNRYYQMQQLNQMQQMNNNLRWLQYGR